MNDLPKLPNSKDIIREASRKLKIVEHQREIQEKFFQKYEEQKEFLNKFENNFLNHYIITILNHQILVKKHFQKFTPYQKNLINWTLTKFPIFQKFQ